MELIIIKKSVKYVIIKSINKNDCWKNKKKEKNKKE